MNVVLVLFPSMRTASETDSTDGVLAEQLLRLTRRLHRIQKHHLEPLGITPPRAGCCASSRTTTATGRPGWRTSPPAWKSCPAP